MKFPLGIQTFSHIRENDYLYIDKTDLIQKLIDTGKAYFLSRPRRFGKSLLLSTIEAVFKGQQHLFKDLAIDNNGHQFAAHPIIKLEFAKDEFTTAENLKDYITTTTNRLSKEHHIELDANSYNQRFDELVVKLQQKYNMGVVLLIDEYDKPILNNLNQPQLGEVKQVITSFYAMVKSIDEHLAFTFITGVTKFAKVSVFSGMNNLDDISMDHAFATLCGVTQAELEQHFSQSITELQNTEALEQQQLLQKIKRWYNGYCFHPKAERLYNPFSLLSLFKKSEFKNYWFSTATPTFLLDLLQHKQYSLPLLTDLAVGDSVFDACEPEEISVQAVFLQTGYLTIKDYQDPLYQLDFPNFEVKKSFFESVTTRYGKLDRAQG